MGNNRKLQFAIRAALATAAATAAVPIAMSQTASVTTTAPTPSLEEVVVTGSRIQSPNLQSISPITSVSAADIEAVSRDAKEALSRASAAEDQENDQSPAY